MSAKPSEPEEAARGGSGPRVLLGVVLTLALAALVHGSTWLWLGGEVEDGFRSWAQSRRESGWRIRHEPPVRGGWPFAVTVTVPGLQVEGGGASVQGGVEWAVPELVLRLSPPLFDRLVAEPRGAQRLRIGQTDIPFAADRIEVVLPFEPGAALRTAELSVDRLRVGTPDGPAELRGMTLRIEARSSATEGEPALVLAFAAHGIDLPSETARHPSVAALGRHVATLALNGTLSGPITFDPDFSLRAEAWREGGGTFELGALSLRWGPVQGSARMTLTLDDALQPMGAGQVQIAGAPAALDALAVAGAINARTAQAARAAFGLLARRPDGGGPPQAELPLTLEDRRLTVGPMQLLRLAPLVWPAPAEDTTEAIDPSLPASR